MSILKSLQEYLQEFDGMTIKTIPEILTDQTEEQTGSYALTPSGNGKTTVDIIGNKTFENNYMLLAKEPAADEVDRAENHDFLEEFSDWLDERNEAGNMPKLPGRYVAEKIEVSNAMLMEIYDDGSGLYQLQIKLYMTKRKG